MSLSGTCKIVAALEPTGCCSDSAQMLEASRAHLATETSGKGEYNFQRNACILNRNRATMFLLGRELTDVAESH